MYILKLEVQLATEVQTVRSGVTYAVGKCVQLAVVTENDTKVMQKKTMCTAII